MPFVFMYLCALFFTHALADMRNYTISSWNLHDKSIPNEEKWNNTIASLLSGRNGADVLALQEVASLPSQARFLQTFTPPYAVTYPIYEYAWNINDKQQVFIYFLNIDTESRGIHLAIISKKRAQAMYAIASSKKPKLPMLAIALGEEIFITLNTADTSTDIASNLMDIYMFFSNVAPPIEWILLGSFHLLPEALQARIPSALQEHIAIIAPSTATRRSGGVLDYAISGNASKQPYQASVIAAYAGFSNMRLQSQSPYIPIILSK